MDYVAGGYSRSYAHRVYNREVKTRKKLTDYLTD